MRDGASGAVHTVVGDYVEVRRPERLSYTWIGALSNASMVTEPPFGVMSHSLTRSRPSALPTRLSRALIVTRSIGAAAAPPAASAGSKPSPR